MSEARMRRDLVRYSRAMHAAGMVANHDGNLSARLNDARLLCTPTAFSKADVGPEDLLVLDAKGDRISGRHRPFSELNLHLAVYAARPEVAAVVHAHPVHATAFGAAGRPLPPPFLPEAVVSLGADVPLVPLAAPGGAAVEALRPFIRRVDAVLIAGNGVLAWGPDLETAWLRLELVEHLCRVAHAALSLGGVKPLPDDMVQGLVAKRRAAGLNAPDEAAPPAAPVAKQASAASPANRAVERALAGLPGADPALAGRLAEEIARALNAP